MFLGVFMEPGGTYFNKYINNIYDDVNLLYKLNKPEEGFTTIENGDSKSVEIPEDNVEKLQNIFNRTKLISKHLEDLEWCVTVLDREAEDKILASAFFALNKLNEGMLDTEISLKKVINSQSSTEEKELAELNLKMLKEIRNNSFEKAVTTTHEKMHKSLRVNELISKSIAPEKTSPPKKGLLGSVWSSTYYAAAGVAGVAGNVASKVYGSKPITSYYETDDKNVNERKDDIVSMIKGERMSTIQTIFRDDKGVVADKYGEYVTAPSIFAADLHRFRSFHLNNKPLFEQKAEYNTNEVARALYREFGKDGANRIMQICNQALMPFILEKRVLPLIVEKWEGLLPEKMLTPSQTSSIQGGGFIMNVTHDKKTDQVTLSIKILLQLHTSEEKEFTAHFISKTVIEIPFNELTEEKLDEERLKAKLQVEDILSKLIINNPTEAKSVLERF